MVRTKQVLNTAQRNGQLVITAAAGGIKPKAKHRYRPGTVALREIRKYQKQTEVKVRKGPFLRLMRESGRLLKDDLRFDKYAVQAFQEVIEWRFISMIQDANMLAIHGKRVTLMVKDIRLARRIREGITGKMWYTRSTLSAAEQAQRDADLEQLARRTARPANSLKDMPKYVKT